MPDDTDLAADDGEETSVFSSEGWAWDDESVFSSEGWAWDTDEGWAWKESSDAEEDVFWHEADEDYFWHFL